MHIIGNCLQYATVTKIYRLVTNKYSRNICYRPFVWSPTILNINTILNNNVFVKDYIRDLMAMKIKDLIFILNL